MSTATFFLIVWQVAQTIAEVLLQFSVFVAIAYLLLYVVFRRFFAKRKIQDKPFHWKAFGHDAWFAALNLSANIVLGLLMSWMIKEGHVTVHKDAPLWPTVLWQFLLYFVLFDFYFYSMHRLLHTRWLYRYVHKFHHRSTSPTPLTAFAFHPVEGMLFNGFVPLMMLFVDFHIASISMIYGYGILNSLLIHSGHEIFPAGWYRNRFTSWYLTPTHHDVHHAKFTCHFGGFMTLWDHILGTERGDFLATYDAVVAKRRTPPAESTNVGQDHP